MGGLLCCSRKKGIFTYFILAVLATSALLLFLYECNQVKIHQPDLRVPIHQPDPRAQILEPDPRVQILLQQWEEIYFGSSNSTFMYTPRAPYIEKCKKNVDSFDSRDAYGRRPEWTHSNWRTEFANRFTDSQEYANTQVGHGPQPPWIKGGDEDNLPMTRHVQTDIWIHQHPKNCSDESVRFLITDWLNLLKYGMGAQLNSMAGILAIALNEKRILVTEKFNRADHEECTGSARGQWSCYFVPETSQQCRERARKLVKDKEAWKNGIITNIKSYPWDDVWFGKVPEYWGRPWDSMKTLDVVDGEIVGKHKAVDRQWWRAQAVKYLMRFKSEYLCMLLNHARHDAFGARAAELVVRALPKNWPQVPAYGKYKEIEDIWTREEPWLPRPILSMHVRQGDKASEMKIFDLKSYMDLANSIQHRFPHLNNIWLSTEMQNVVDEAKFYKAWEFYYTNIERQNGTTSMGAYETSLGRIRSSNNAFINFIMAVDCDYFVGALGSTWSFLIDGVRLTSGKLHAGFLSVNKDRYW